MITNTECARRAEETLNRHEIDESQGRDDYLTDLLTDLLHYCRLHELDLDDSLAAARDYFNAEQRPVFSGRLYYRDEDQILRFVSSFAGIEAKDRDEAMNLVLEREWDPQLDKAHLSPFFEWDNESTPTTEPDSPADSDDSVFRIYRGNFYGLDSNKVLHCIDTFIIRETSAEAAADQARGAIWKEAHVAKGWTPAIEWLPPMPSSPSDQQG
jgi:hypothetical protein